MNTCPWMGDNKKSYALLQVVSLSGCCPEFNLVKTLLTKHTCTFDSTFEVLYALSWLQMLAQSAREGDEGCDGWIWFTVSVVFTGIGFSAGVGSGTITISLSQVQCISPGSDTHHVAYLQYIQWYINIRHILWNGQLLLVYITLVMLKGTIGTEENIQYTPLIYMKGLFSTNQQPYFHIKKK